jgi:hypothetical protein
VTKNLGNFISHGFFPARAKYPWSIRENPWFLFSDSPGLQAFAREVPD